MRDAVLHCSISFVICVYQSVRLSDIFLIIIDRFLLIIIAHNISAHDLYSEIHEEDVVLFFYLL